MYPHGSQFPNVIPPAFHEMHIITQVLVSVAGVRCPNKPPENQHPAHALKRPVMFFRQCYQCLRFLLCLPWQLTGTTISRG